MSPVEPFSTPARRLEALRLGMRIFLASLAVLFLATAIAFLVVRFSPEVSRSWHGIVLPWELLVSTGLLAASGLACESAWRAIRRGEREKLGRRLDQCALAALGFVVIQGWCWWRLLRGFDVVAAFRGEPEAAPIVAAWMFVVLTALHAAHVVGGLIPMLRIARGTRSGTSTTAQREAVMLLRAYWHFLGIVWIGIAALLLAALPEWT